MKPRTLDADDVIEMFDVTTFEFLSAKCADLSSMPKPKPCKRTTTGMGSQRPRNSTSGPLAERLDLTGVH